MYTRGEAEDVLAVCIVDLRIFFHDQLQSLLIQLGALFLYGLSLGLIQQFVNLGNIEALAVALAADVRAVEQIVQEEVRI